MRKREGPALAVEYRAELVQARRTICRIAHIVFAGPDHLHRPVDRFRNLRSFYSVIMLEPAPETSADQQDMNLYVVGVEPDGGRN